MKNKHKNRPKAQRVQAIGGKKPNPFDLIFTKRQKNTTIGKTRAAQKLRRKQTSTEIRKQTLEEGFRRRGKANQFVDRRLGQRNVKMSEEARAEKRFLFQQRKLAEKRTTALGSAVNGKDTTNPLLLENPTKRVHWNWKHLMAAAEEAKLEDHAGNSSGNGEAENGMDHEDEADGEEATFGLENVHKNRKEQLADQKRDDRRLRALKSMLRDEHGEQIDRLDQYYRQMRKLGMLLSREQPQQANEQDTYDSMYHELQFQSSQIAAASIPSTPVVAAENSTKTTATEEINSNPPAEEQTDEKPKSLKMLEPRIDEHFNPEWQKKGNGAKFGGKDSAKQREQQWAKRARKERRGAIKELRKDARHLAGLYAEQQRKVRRERDEKTKRIMRSLETQESEYKKMRAISGKLK